MVAVQTPVDGGCNHPLKKLDYPVPCWYCQHGYIKPIRRTTTFACSVCRIPDTDKPVPLHKPSHRLPCWSLHLVALPKKRKTSPGTNN